MDWLEYMILAPIAYIVLTAIIHVWNEDVDTRYDKAKNLSELLMGEGKHYEAKLLMERALIDYKRSKIRKVLGVKV